MAVHPHPDMRRTWRWCGICSPSARVNQHVKLLANVDCRSKRHVWCWKKAWTFARGNPVTCSSWHVGWNDEDLTNGLQEVQISQNVSFSCWAERRRRFNGQNLAQWKNRRTAFGKLSPTSDTTSCRRLWIPSPLVWGNWRLSPEPVVAGTYLEF